MPDAAHEVYKSLTSFSRLQQMIDDGESEGLHLECKAPTVPRVTRDLRVHLAKAASGFGNTAGGVVIWGISTTRHGHSGLDILSQLEPVGSCARFDREIRRALPTVTTPAMVSAQTKVIKRRKSDTRGVVVAHIPRTQGDPLQSTQDNLFYFRTGDQFSVAPYEMIKRLFSATATPDLKPLFVSRLTSLEEHGSWKLPIGVENLSSAVARDAVISVMIDNPSACDIVRSSGLADRSDINPGAKVFMANFQGVIHRRLSIIIGNLIVKMKVGRRARRRLDLSITLYADRMRAKKYSFVVQLAQKGLSVRKVSETHLY